MGARKKLGAEVLPAGASYRFPLLPHIIARPSSNRLTETMKSLRAKIGTTGTPSTILTGESRSVRMTGRTGIPTLAFVLYRTVRSIWLDATCCRVETEKDLPQCLQSAEIASVCPSAKTSICLRGFVRTTFVFTVKPQA